MSPGNCERTRLGLPWDRQDESGFEGKSLFPGTGETRAPLEARTGGAAARRRCLLGGEREGRAEGCGEPDRQGKAGSGQPFLAAHTRTRCRAKALTGRETDGSVCGRLGAVGRALRKQHPRMNDNHIPSLRPGNRCQVGSSSRRRGGAFCVRGCQSSGDR